MWDIGEFFLKILNKCSVGFKIQFWAEEDEFVKIMRMPKKFKNVCNFP